jgi:hypothetical protein
MISDLEGSMNPVTNVSFKRAVDEFVRWRAVPEDARSPAPAWWWGPAFEARDVTQTMPTEWCSGLELPDGSTFADGANVFLRSFAGQKSLPWPEEFPGKA